MKQKIDENLLILSGTHNGYLTNYKKICKRTLFINKKKELLRGEDTIISTKSIIEKNVYHIRFHLMPEISTTITENKKNIIIKTKKNNIWMFRSNKEMIIEKSIFVRNDIANETTQIVISGITSITKHQSRMVTRKNMKRNALISVYDKSSLKKICNVLNKFNIGIISTGATAKKIISLGYKCKEISNLTKFKEILDGRVKTLNSKLHASILYKRSNPEHEKLLKNLNFPIIDFVIVNFYPFTKISNKEITEKKIEMIDIGGPSMIRSASKNFESVTTICDKKFYDPLIKELTKNKGVTSLAFRKKMAERNFKLTSDYDLSIFRWFNRKK